MKTANKLIIASVFLTMALVLAYSGIKPGIAQASYYNIFEYTITGNTVPDIVTRTGNAVDCSGQPPAGYTLSKRECLISDTLGLCNADICLWKKPSANIFEYTFTSVRSPEENAVNCSGNQPSGYTFVQRSCVVGNNGVCVSDVCLWERPSTTAYDYTMTHEGSGYPLVDCSDNIPIAAGAEVNPIGYEFVKRECVYPTRCITDICLWKKQSQNTTPTCSSNTDCGANAYTGSPYCSGGNVYQNYKTYTCNNAGTSTSYCSDNTAPQLKTTCTGNQTCNNGSCTSQNITCSSNTDCGANAYTGSPFCQGNNVYQNYITYTCNNAGTGTSYCSNNTASQLKTNCTGNQTCSNGSCSGNNCTNHSYEQCIGSNLYWYNSCGIQQDLVQYCPNGCSGNSCTNNNNQNCTQNSYQRCSGNYLYWYDSCGNQQGSGQYCPNGCSGNSCTYNSYNPYGNCTYHAYKLCIGNNIYWYDSCGNQQDLFQNCVGTNLTCVYGLCVAASQAVIVPSYNTYVAHYRTGCHNNNLYWYDSLGGNSGLAQSCSDTNSCTLDSCASGKCSNTIKCDGSTCAVGSSDYNSYCSGSTNNINNNNAGVNVLSVSFFAKQDQNSTQWQKTVQVNSNGQVYFMISVANNSSLEVNNVNISANIPSEITSLGNLQINGVPVSGDIVSGINIGSLSQANAKSITFEGKTQSILVQAIKQAIATSNVSGATQSDFVSINLNPGQVAGAAVSSTQTTSSWSGFWTWLKRWYLWILVALVLIFLFIVVFRRLSSNNT